MTRELAWKTDWKRSATVGETTIVIEHQVAVSGTKKGREVEVRRTLYDGKPTAYNYSNTDDTQKLLEGYTRDREERRVANLARAAAQKKWEADTGLVVGAPLMGVEIEAPSDFYNGRAVLTVSNLHLSIGTTKEILRLLKNAACNGECGMPCERCGSEFGGAHDVPDCNGVRNCVCS